MFRAVDDDGLVAGLPAQAGAGAPVGDGRAVIAAHGHCLDEVVNVFRDDDADRYLPVVGGVSGVRRSHAAAEMDLPPNPPLQVGFERAGAAVQRRSRACRVRPANIAAH